MMMMTLHRRLPFLDGHPLKVQNHLCHYHENDDDDDDLIRDVLLLVVVERSRVSSGKQSQTATGCISLGDYHLPEA